MSNTDRYLDYEGLQRYHSELVQRVTDLNYDPNRMFDDEAALLDTNNWGFSKYGRIAGVKEGLIVTVGDKIWQLDDASTFKSILEASGTVESKLATYDTPEKLGWKVISNTVDFNINEHTLELTK